MGCTPSKDVIASSSDCPTEIMFSNNANKEVNSGSAIPEKAPEKELKRYGCIGSQSDDDELLCSDNRNYGSELPTEENCKELAMDLVRKGDNRGAIKYYQNFLSNGVDQTIENDNICGKIGAIYYKTGFFSEAHLYFEKGLAISERVHGTRGHPAVADRMVSVAESLDAMKKYDQALRMYQKAFEIRKNIYGRGHEATMSVQTDIAWTLRNLKRFKEAIDCFVEVLVVQTVLTTYNADVVTTYSYLGKLHLENGDHRRSLLSCEKALSMSQFVSGNESEETATCYFNLGRVLYESGAYKGSIENYEKSLVIRKSLLGDSHPKIAVTYYHIGMALDKDGDVDEALTCMMKAVEIEDQCPSIAEEVNRFNKIASLYVHDKSDYERALFYFFKALDCFLEEKQREGDPNLRLLCAHKYETIALMHVMKKNYDDAVTNYRKALTIRNLVQSYEHEDTRRCCDNIGEVLVRAGNYDMALFYIATVKDIRENSQNPLFTKLYHSYKAMENVYRLKGDIERSNEYLMKAEKLQTSQQSRS